MDERSRELSRQFLSWVAAAPRTYDDVIENWRSTCPRLSIWEDALNDGLIRFAADVVTITTDGTALLRNVDDAKPPDRSPGARLAPAATRGGSAETPRGRGG